LFQFPAGCMAQLRARAPQVMRRHGPETELGSVLLHHAPNQSLGYAVAKRLSGSAHTSEYFPRIEFGGISPYVHGRLDPNRHRHGPNMSAFAHQIDNRPVYLSLLQMREVQISQFVSSQPAPK